MLKIDFVRGFALFFQQSTQHLDPAFLQTLQTFAIDGWIRVQRTDNHFSNCGCQDTIRTWRLFSMMVAGLKIDVQSSAFRYTPVNRIKRLNLRVQAAEIAVIPFRYYAIALYNHSPYHGVGANSSATLLRIYTRSRIPYGLPDPCQEYTEHTLQAGRSAAS